LRERFDRALHALRLAVPGWGGGSRAARSVATLQDLKLSPELTVLPLQLRSASLFFDQLCRKRLQQAADPLPCRFSHGHRARRIP
jgi:hypothetical protein